MPKVKNYPDAAFEKCLELANAIESLGGECLSVTAAEKLNRTESGAYGVLVSATVKYGLITNIKSTLKITDLFKKIIHAYTEDEALVFKREAFLKPEVFKLIYERLKGKGLDANILGKMFIREYDVDSKSAQKVAGYFIKGIKSLGLLDQQNNLLNIEFDPTENKDKDILPEEDNRVEEVKVEDVKSSAITVMQHPFSNEEEYIIHLKGPTIDSRLVIKDEDDFVILTSYINKIRKAILNG
ncbi:hypothetical protein [Sphingobacterium thalpophilum]|uniref:Uncharacterized protein n=1 Tax=Sphingobacterium thalpophilum TaxID=259 RepID=A0A4V6KMS6_9SPHI|nr:hypothetical protein [Sphingobacterium thalpophilum]VTR27918.1 Uncharacterised protein [Sphingobacterium thalpophilum]